jgi:hypothetical protein
MRPKGRCKYASIFGQALGPKVCIFWMHVLPISLKRAYPGMDVSLVGKGSDPGGLNRWVDFLGTRNVRPSIYQGAEGSGASKRDQKRSRILSDRVSVLPGNVSGPALRSPSHQGAQVVREVEKARQVKLVSSRLIMSAGVKLSAALREMLPVYCSSVKKKNSNFLYLRKYRLKKCFAQPICLAVVSRDQL